MMSYPVLVRVARTLSDDALVANLTAKAAELDGWAAAGVNPSDSGLRRERALVAALREEYRRRTGEVV